MEACNKDYYYYYYYKNPGVYFVDIVGIAI